MSSSKPAGWTFELTATERFSYAASTRQVGEAIKRSHIYVSRRLRVFDDPVLAPLVLGNELPVSTAEELLREPNVDLRRELVPSS